MNWTLLQHSLLVSAGTTLLSASIGFVTALWLVGLRPAWRNRVLVVSVVALMLPPFLVTNCWLHFLGMTGVWRSWLPLDIYSLGGTTWILTLLTWPISCVATLGGWQRLESAQLESDPAMAGAALVRWLLWPMARVSLAQAAVLTFVLTLNNFAVPAILQVKVLPAEVWVRFSTNFDSAGALAAGWPLILAPLLLLVVLHRAEIIWNRATGPVAARAIRRQLGPLWFWGCAAVGVAILLLSVGLPLTQISAVERTWTELPKVFRAVPGVIWNSFLLSALAASACVGIALAARRYSDPMRSFSGQGNCRETIDYRTPHPRPLPVEGRGRKPRGSSGHLDQRFSMTSGVLSLHFPWSLVLWLPLLVPGVLLGVAIIWGFNRPVLDVLYRTAGIVLIGWTIRYLALGWHGVAFALQGVDRDLTDAARLEGASGWSLLRHVHWPQIAPQVGAAWYVTYLLCLWDVETLVLISPPGGETLALRIFNLLHYGHNAQVNALCLLLLALAVAPLGVWRLWRVLRSHGPVTNDE